MKQWYNDPTNTIEIKALIRLMYMYGVLKNSGFTTSDIFSRVYGPPMIHAVMNEKRSAFFLIV